MNMSAKDLYDLTWEEFCIKCEAFNKSKSDEDNRQWHKTIWLYTSLGSLQVDKKGQQTLQKTLKDFEDNIYSDIPVKDKPERKKLTEEQVKAKTNKFNKMFKSLN